MQILRKDRLLLGLLIVDAIFCLLHLLLVDFQVLTNPRFSVEKDRGFAEFFQYGKFLAIAVLLLVRAARERSWLSFSWALLFCYLLADDSMIIHEIQGDAVATYFGFGSYFGLRPSDFGELSLESTAGIIFLTPILLLLRKSEIQERTFSIGLLLLLAVFAIFSIGIDMLHTLFLHSSWGSLLGLLEDSGEMFTVSFTVWFVLSYTSTKPMD